MSSVDHNGYVGQSFELEGETYTVIADHGEYDYSWHTKVLLRRTSDGALFTAEDSGCSCYGFADSPDMLELTPVSSWQEAATGDAELGTACLAEKDAGRL